MTASKYMYVYILNSQNKILKEMFSHFMGLFIETDNSDILNFRTCLINGQWGLMGINKD